jgi:hypothetical protein
MNVSQLRESTIEQIFLVSVGTVYPGVLHAIVQMPPASFFARRDANRKCPLRSPHEATDNYTKIKYWPCVFTFFKLPLYLYYHFLVCIPGVKLNYPKWSPTDFRLEHLDCVHLRLLGTVRISVQWFDHMLCDYATRKTILTRGHSKTFWGYQDFPRVYALFSLSQFIIVFPVGLHRLHFFKFHLSCGVSRNASRYPWYVTKEYEGVKV